MKRLLLVLALLSPCFGQISKDTAVASSVGSSVGSLAWSHTVNSGSNRVLAVSCGAGDNSVPGHGVVSGITFDAAAFTQVGSNLEAGAGNISSVWYLIAPTVSTGTITVTFAGSPTNSQCGSISLFGVHQTTPVDVSGGANALSVVLTTTVANDWIIDAASVGAANSGRINGFGAGQTAILGGSTSTQGGSYSGPVATGSNTVSFTTSAFAQESYFAAAFQPAGGAAAGGATITGAAKLTGTAVVK